LRAGLAADPAVAKAWHVKGKAALGAAETARAFSSTAPRQRRCGMRSSGCAYVRSV
jgi:hypothetical protein